MDHLGITVRTGEATGFLGPDGAGERVGAFSLGMGQRLGVVSEGRAVMLSAHPMSETALIADHLVISGHGRLLADTTVEDFTPGGERLGLVGGRRRGRAAAFAAGWPRRRDQLLLRRGSAGHRP